MLVLSRKQSQCVVFPNLGISVEILRVAGKTVRVGVDAPRNVSVLRGELVDMDTVGEAHAAARQVRHQLRNRLNAANLALHLLQAQIDAGQFSEAEQTLSRALDAFQEVDALACGQTRPVSPVRQENSTRRALVVEDNANERELLAGYLRLCGYQADAVEDGMAAMDYLAQNERPDIVLLDMQMPRMDGCETISRIRRNPDYRGIKLFVVSGLDRSTMRVPAGDRGVDRWFSKPLKPAEFANELKAEMDGVCALA